MTHWRDYQFAQKVLELGNRYLSYVDLGEGSPLVFLHGMLTWGYIWHGLLPNFVPDYRLLIPDLMGFGYSDKSDNFDRSIVRQAEWIGQWIEELELGPVTLIGHDIGGGVALRMALSNPSLVERLCLISPVCYDSWPLELMLEFGHPQVNRKLSAHALTLVLKETLRAGFHEQPHSEILDGIVAPYSTEVGKISLIRNMVSMNTSLTTEITRLLPLIQIPTQILWGENDRFQPSSYGERLVFDIPGARFHSIAKAKHFVMLDRPLEMTEALLQFISSTRPVSKEKAWPIPQAQG